MRLAGRISFPSWAFALSLVALLLLISFFGQLTGNWQGTVPDPVIQQVLRAP
jgi:hypothetical protein